MDFSENNDFKLAMEKAEAEMRLASAPVPDRLNEDWRFGRPHRYAKELIDLLDDTGRVSSGIVRLHGPAEAVCEDCDDEQGELLMQSIGSDSILARHIKRFGRGATVFIEGEPAEPITITYETDSLFTPTTCIMAAPGAKARIIERHITRNGGVMVCTRRIMAAEGADISVELREEGSGDSRTMNITNITAIQAVIRHLTQHCDHLWAREETIAELLGGEGTDVQLFSANRLKNAEVLDQHTRQIHTNGQTFSNLLYKNVVDDKATAVFAGNIYVAPGAHRTDAYQANRNMLLSETAAVHSLPGLEILADKVRCSHGSASAPMDSEQLFYLLSRGIPKHEAQTLVAQGFLEDVFNRFRGE